MGNIVKEFGFMTQLERLSLGSNIFTGTCPTQVGSLVTIQVLRLAHNQIGGTLPSGLNMLDNLKIFNVSENRLGGSIEPELFPLFSLSKLLESNLFLVFKTLCDKFLTIFLSTLILSLL